MRMQMTSQIDAGGNDPIFLMFHGYGNDESEMMRILDAVYAPTRADAAPAAIAAVPSYISFRATYARPYMGGITGIPTAAAWTSANANARRSGMRWLHCWTPRHSPIAGRY